MSESAKSTFGRYQLLARLATGGMAEIHLAKTSGIEQVERLVVVKKILPHLSREQRFLEMFLDEARITVLLNHPNIVQTYDLGQEDGQYFLAMEYLEGESLGYLMREAHATGKPLPPELAASMIASVCDGLAYAHALCDHQGQHLHIVHRDVSPQNIIVLFSGFVKLVDFGIAKAATRVHQTRVGTMKGKLVYMAPEQCRGAELDARADIFSLGAVMWELLARRRLFKRDNEAAIIQAVVNEDPPPLGQIQPGVPPELEAIALRALAKEPGDRYADCNEMAAEIREFLRRTQAAAGPAEIAAYVHGVFADRARTKSNLLEKIRNSNGQEISLEILKPDTSESMPSRSAIEMAETQAVPSPLPDLTAAKTQASMRKLAEQESLAAQTELRPVSDEQAPPPPSPSASGRPTWMVYALAGVFTIAIGLGAMFLLSPGREDRAGIGAGSAAVVDAGAAAAADGADGDEGRGEAGAADVADPPPSADPGPGRAPPVESAAGQTPAVDPQAPRATRLDVQTEPAGCEVLIDGAAQAGRSPLAAVAVAPGTEHQVLVRCDGYHDQKKNFVAGAGQTIQLDFAPRKQRIRRTRPGLLRLDTDPWSVVYLGKRKLGMTPLLGVSLPAGRHQLTLVNEKAGLRKVVSVRIRSKKTTTRFEKLKP